MGLPLALLSACLWSNPFPQVIAEKTVALSTLSPAQKTNIGVATRYLEGLVLQPGETFSFNQAVGPRTVKRGYLPAPSYLGGESPATVGGGICLLSSALYQLALSAGLSITQRVPHLKTIHSVPPGLDATVWYGGADLRLQNSYAKPVRLRFKREPNSLTAILTGTERKPLQPIRKTVSKRSETELLVTVFQGERMVSRDLYRISP